MKVILLAFGLGACAAVDTPQGVKVAEVPDRDVTGRILEEGTCGSFCKATGYNTPGLRKCLLDEFSTDGTKDVTCVRGVCNFPQIVFDDDGDHYIDARRSNNGISQPIAIAYVGDTVNPSHEENVRQATVVVNCAREFGYKVAVRGHSHNYNNQGGQDGYVVIDMANTCHRNTTEPNMDNTGEHLIPGSRYIATVKFGAGCNNAFVIGMLDEVFASEMGALALTGSCTSVGVVGFALGGGQGDASPFIGLAVDALEEVELVDWEGNKLTASKTENSDLFWGLQGGGGGLGVVTSITFKIVQSPPPKLASARQFSLITVAQAEAYIPGSRKAELIVKLQTWFANGPKEITSKFGGAGLINGFGIQMRLLYLGSYEEAMADLQEFSTLLEDPEDFAVSLIRQTSSFAKLMGFFYCFNTISDMAFGNEIRWTNPTLRKDGDSPPTVDMCLELGLDAELCLEEVQGFIPSGPTIRVLKATSCFDPDVVETILESARDQQSFLNHFGPNKEVNEHYFESLAPFLTPGLPQAWSSYTWQAHKYPGINIPELEVETWTNFIHNTEDQFQTVFANHLNHGAPTIPKGDDTAYPWRESWTLTGDGFLNDASLPFLLQDKAYDDASDLWAYWNVPGTVEQAGWERLYFGNNYERLQIIKAKYDPVGMFTKPMTPKPAVAMKNEEASPETGKTTKNEEASPKASKKSKTKGTKSDKKAKAV